MTIDEVRKHCRLEIKFQDNNIVSKHRAAIASLTLALLDEHEHVTTVDDEGYNRWEAVERLLEEL